MKVTSLQFQREFARYRTLAQREPVIITIRGREDVVLIAAEDFSRVCRYLPKAYYASELPKGIVEELGTVPIPKSAAKRKKPSKEKAGVIGVTKSRGL